MDCSTFAFDLHVLGTPPALILSQDQTLMLNSPSPHSAVRRDGGTTQLTRGRFIGSALFNPVYLSWSPPVAESRTDKLGRSILRRHALTLIVYSLALSS